MMPDESIVPVFRRASDLILIVDHEIGFLASNISCKTL
jgi:hypothetical protein